MTKNAAKTQKSEPARRENKTDKVIALLKRKGGATLEEMTKATGWLPHTVRASLTGLRKKGHMIERGRRGETTCWSITASAKSSA